jgi:hypothetical protein
MMIRHEPHGDYSPFNPFPLNSPTVLRFDEVVIPAKSLAPIFATFLLVRLQDLQVPEPDRAAGQMARGRVCRYPPAPYRADLIASSMEWDGRPRSHRGAVSRW